MSRPRLLSSIPQEPWDPARDPGNITREPWDPAREPWDIGWLLREDQQEGPRGSRAQPSSELGFTYCDSRYSPRPPSPSAGDLDTGACRH